MHSESCLKAELQGVLFFHDSFALAFIGNIRKKCVKEKRLRFSEKIVVVVLLASLVYPFEGCETRSKRI